jgi:hypothetical protein
MVVESWYGPSYALLILVILLLLILFGSVITGGTLWWFSGVIVNFMDAYRARKTPNQRDRRDCNHEGESS